MPDYQPNYVVGRGRLYFGQFKDGSNTPKGGELYFGNTPELTLTTDSETLDHYSSEQGLREMDARVLLELTQGGNFTTDEINADNLALHFLGDNVKMTQTQVTGKQEIIGSLEKARYYQLGMSTTLPTGVRDITNLTIGVVDADVAISLGDGDISTIDGITMLPLSGNIEADLANARLYTEPDAAGFNAGMQAVVQYDVNAQSRTQIISRSKMVYGSLRFISDNPVGSQKDYYFPKVALQPDGDYALKGDDWQVMSFTFSALKLGSAYERVYIDVRDASKGMSPAEQRSVIAGTAPATGTVGTAVPVVFTVRDGYNNIVPGVQVTFSASNGGTVSPASGTTNSSGQVTANLNRASAGSSTVTGTLAGGANATSTSVAFTA